MAQKEVTVSFQGTSILAQVTAAARARSETPTGLKLCPWTTVMLDFIQVCRGVG